MTVFLFSDGRFQGHRLLRNLQNFPHPLHRKLHLFCNFFRRGFPAQLLQQLTGYPDQLIDGLHHMHWNPDGSGLIRNSPCNRLTDPPGSVGTELKALAVVKLLHRLNQSQVSLLNQIQEKHTTAHITLGDTDNQT